MGKEPELAGVLELELRVQADGSLPEPEQRSSTPENEEVGACVRARLSRASFPVAAAPTRAVLRYDFAMVDPER